MTINGTYVLEKNENLDGFLKVLGIPEEKAQHMCAAKPTVTITLTGTKLDISSKIGDKNVQNTLTLGAPSKYTLASGFELEVTLTISGTSGKGTLKQGDRSGTFTLDFTDTHVTEIFNVEGSTCKRIYKRA